MSFARIFASSATRAAPRLRVAGVSINARTFASTGVTAAPSLTEAITEDHRKLHQYYNEIVNSNDNEHKERWGNQFIWELARHSVAEEIVIYPSMEHYMPHGKGRAHAEKDRKQHHELKVMLKDFQNLRAGDPEYIPQLKRLYSHLENHIKEEESDDLPALEKALADPDNASNSEQLAKSFSRTKAIAPSRSHPAAGENPNVEATAGLPVAIFDHIADLFRKYPEGKVSPNPSTK